MYRYKTKEKHCVRFVFPDGREINLLGEDVSITYAATAVQPKRTVTITGATDEDFEKILRSDRYKSLHKKIEKTPDKKPVKPPIKKSVKKKKDVPVPNKVDKEGSDK